LRSIEKFYKTVDSGRKKIFRDNILPSNSRVIFVQKMKIAPHVLFRIILFYPYLLSES